MTLSERATIAYLKVRCILPPSLSRPLLPHFICCALSRLGRPRDPHYGPKSRALRLNSVHRLPPLPRLSLDALLPGTAVVAHHRACWVRLLLFSSCTPDLFLTRLLILILCSDTRIILCQTVDGAAIPLTEKHHADARVEAARLRRFGMGAGGSIVDAFGESRWMGAVENTRR